jgi:hypothetical protein
VWGLLRPRKFPYAVRGSQTHKFSFGLVSLSLSISPSICTCTYIYIYLGTLSIGFFDHPTQPSLASLPTQVPSDDLTHTHTHRAAAELPTIQGLINYLFDQESSSSFFFYPPPFYAHLMVGARHYRFLV